MMYFISFFHKLLPGQEISSLSNDEETAFRSLIFKILVRSTNLIEHTLKPPITADPFARFP